MQDLIDRIGNYIPSLIAGGMFFYAAMNAESSTVKMAFYIMANVWIAAGFVADRVRARLP